jgi:hypothetical protein
MERVLQKIREGLDSGNSKTQEFLLRVHRSCAALLVRGVPLFAICVVLMLRGDIGNEHRKRASWRLTIDASDAREWVQKVYTMAKFKSPTQWTGQYAHACRACD